MKLWALALVLLVSACTPPQERWQVAVTASSGVYSDGALIVEGPDHWAAARSQEAAVAGVLSTQRLVSAWAELVGAPTADAVVQVGDTGYPVTVEAPQIIADGAIRFPVLSGEAPPRWGPGAVIVTIGEPLRDSVAMQAGDWTTTLTAGPGTVAGDTLAATQVASAGVVMNGREARSLTTTETVNALAGQRGFLVALVNRTPVATPVVVGDARLSKESVRVTFTAEGSPPPGFNRMALLLDRD